MDLDKVKAELLEERARLDRELEVSEAELSESLPEVSGESPYGQHPAEDASGSMEREMDLLREPNLRAALSRIDRALEKIAAGEYGRCDRCGVEIGEQRLLAAPYANVCMDCRRLEERTR